MVPDRRTLIVLGSLVAGMTLTSMLLLLLEPGPVAPWSGVTLQSIEQNPDSDERLFDVLARPNEWDAIVIHDSGTSSGSARQLHEAHEVEGRGGLGYHFVLANGNGQADGLIEMGFRWRRQSEGAYLDAHSPRAAWFHQNAIGICLIGDMDHRPLTEAQRDNLLWLVRELQEAFDIPADRIYLDVGSEPDTRAAEFPYLSFREQLLR